MSHNRDMHEQMAPISVREATHYSAYWPSATRVDLQKARQQGTTQIAVSDKLLDYQLKVTYKKGKELHVADTLSRAALKDLIES